LADDDEAERQEFFRIILVTAALTPHVNHLHHQHNHRQDEETKDLGWLGVRPVVTLPCTAKTQSSPPPQAKSEDALPETAAAIHHPHTTKDKGSVENQRNPH
jgi:hypothetical protein